MCDTNRKQQLKTGAHTFENKGMLLIKCEADMYPELSNKLRV